ncbi:hypothetical protein AMK15_24760 [Streptomyces sp. MJM1172]|nr:hypothetical protein AMK15_24760 [Streptomyces sp. MJM1172]
MLVTDLPEVGNHQALGLDRLLRTPERLQRHAEVGQGQVLAVVLPGQAEQLGCPGERLDGLREFTRLLEDVA